VVDLTNIFVEREAAMKRHAEITEEELIRRRFG